MLNNMFIVIDYCYFTIIIYYSFLFSSLFTTFHLSKLINCLIIDFFIYKVRVILVKILYCYKIFLSIELSIQ